jgi:hypothetical protein
VGPNEALGLPPVTVGISDGICDEKDVVGAKVCLSCPAKTLSMENAKITRWKPKLLSILDE